MPADSPGRPPQRIESSQAWDQILGSLPSPHLLQSGPWGEFKTHYGWTAHRLAWFGPADRPLAAAQVLQRKWPARRGSPAFSVFYCPRGPALSWEDGPLVKAVLADLARLAAGPGAMMIKIEPDVEASPPVEAALRATGWFVSTQPVQFGSTMVLDLSRSEEQLLEEMKSKTRYNIRLAERKGVVVRDGTSDDLDLLYEMYAETSVRDGFVIRPRAYYRRVWDDFATAGLARPLVAEVDGVPVAGLIVYRFGDRAWYLYGMSRALHRDRMPNHALQWAAIRWARRAGCRSYDLWGAPQAPDPADPMWGVYRFKEGFGARHLQLIGSWEATTRPLAHHLYTAILPRVLGWTRRRQQERTRQLVDPAG